MTEKQYPKALAIGSVAYDVSSILGLALAGLLIATIGFRGSFLVDAGTFALSALLVIALPRAAIEVSNATRTAPWHGIGAMFKRPALRESLLLALQVSVGGAFVLVGTVDFVKEELALPDRFYAWAMALYSLAWPFHSGSCNRNPIELNMSNRSINKDPNLSTRNIFPEKAAIYQLILAPRVSICVKEE